MNNRDVPIVKQIRIIAMLMLHFYKLCKHKCLPTSWANAVVHLRKLKRSLAHLPDILKCVVNTKAFLLGRYRCSSPSTKEVPSAPTSWVVTVVHLHQLKRSVAHLPDQSIVVQIEPQRVHAHHKDIDTNVKLKREQKGR